MNNIQAYLTKKKYIFKSRKGLGKTVFTLYYPVKVI